jgi:hypoxanthine-guanine phosphoribosyltransferase
VGTLIAAVLVLLLGAAACLLPLSNRLRAAIGILSQLVATALVWTVVVPVLLGGAVLVGELAWAYPVGTLRVRLDALGAFVLAWSLPMTLLGSVYALGYLIDVLDPEDRLLVIDDVFDTGRSVEAFLLELKARCRHNMPETVKIATAYYKPSRNQTSLKPDYFVHETEEWLVFPHEICGLTEAEIRVHKPGAALILREGS